MSLAWIEKHYKCGCGQCFTKNIAFEKQETYYCPVHQRIINETATRANTLQEIIHKAQEELAELKQNQYSFKQDYQRLPETEYKILYINGQVDIPQHLLKCNPQEVLNALKKS